MSDKAPKQSEGNPRMYLVGGGILLVVVLAVVAVLLSNSGRGSEGLTEGMGAYAAARADREQAPVEITGKPLSEYPDVPPGLIPEGKDPAVGETPPKLEGLTFDGSPVVINPGDGRAKVVMFIAHWCPHCQNEVPLIQEWINGGGLPDDVQIYAVSTSVSSDRANYPPSKWIVRERFTPSVLLDNADSSAARAWSLPGYPYFVALNSDGTVAQRGNGEVSIDEFAAMVRKLN